MFHVKHEATPLSPESVVGRLRPLGIAVSESQAARLVGHAELVLQHNKHVNLTRIVDPQSVLDLHIVDSLAFLPLVDVRTGKWVDIGSGAGYPGIPLAIMGYDVALCESVKKKAAFLASAVRELSLDSEVLPLRAEELALSSSRAFDVVVARAVTALPALVELASPLLRPHGCLIAMKGRPAAAEREQALEACSVVGMRLQSDAEYDLPNGDPRSVFVYERHGTPRISLPRRPGMAQRQPFGVST